MDLAVASNQELQEAARFHDDSLFSRQVVAVVETDIVWSETARPPHPSRDWAPDASGIGIEGGRGLNGIIRILVSLGRSLWAASSQPC